MTQAKRDRLRRLQDKFLVHPKVEKWVKIYGPNELFGPNTPSYEDLKNYLYPEYEERIRAFLGKED